MPLNVIDTAGLRDSGDEVERLGMARTREAIARGLVLHLTEAGSRADPADAAILQPAAAIRAFR